MTVKRLAGALRKAFRKLTLMSPQAYRARRMERTA
jgi:AraC-like DNA-binding protein